MGTTANASLLLGTAAHDALPNSLTRDYIIAPNFFSTTAEPFPGIEYWAYDNFIFSAGMLPLNGKDSLDGSGGTAPNSPTNFAGETGNVDACPWDLDGDHRHQQFPRPARRLAQPIRHQGLPGTAGRVGSVPSSGDIGILTLCSAAQRRAMS